MEHRGSLLIGLLGFGFVAFVLIKLASQIDTHPDIGHFRPPPTRTARPRSQVSIAEAAEERRNTDRQRATMELLVDVAASQSEDGVRDQLGMCNASFYENLDCALRAKERVPWEDAASSAGSPGERVSAWRATFCCMNENVGYEVTFLVNLVFTGGRWQIEAETQRALQEGELPKARCRRMTTSEHALALRSAPGPASALPTRPGP